MTLVTKSGLPTAAAVLKKGPKAVLVNEKGACSHLWLVSVFLTVSALPCARHISSAFLHGVFPLFTANRAILCFDSIKEVSLVQPLHGIPVVGGRSTKMVGLMR